MGQGRLQGGKCGGEKKLGGKNFGVGVWWDSKEKLVGASVRHSGNLQYNLVLGEGRRTASFRGVPDTPPPLGESQYTQTPGEDSEREHTHTRE